MHTECVRVETVGRGTKVPNKDTRIQLQEAFPPRKWLLFQQSRFHARLMNARLCNGLAMLVGSCVCPVDCFCMVGMFEIHRDKKLCKPTTPDDGAPRPVHRSMFIINAILDIAGRSELQGIIIVPQQTRLGKDAGFWGKCR